MIFSKFNVSFLFIIIFLSSCSSMNVTEETVYSGEVRTVQASTSSNKEDISYESQAVFANATIYFDFDKTNLSSKSLQTLKSVVDVLDDNSQLNVVLAGHADERGTREYNLALGQRRADAVSQYLILNGIENNRIITKSYGEERPIANGQDEESYAKNRRVEIN